MRINSIGRLTSVCQTQRTKLQYELDWIKTQIGRSRHQGKNSISFIINDSKLIQRLQNIYGQNRVKVETSPNKKVTIKF